MKRYRIFFYHGRNANSALVDELSAFCTTDKDNDLFFEGSLDDFATQYSRMFIVKLSHDTAHDNIICVTPYNSWGAR